MILLFIFRNPFPSPSLITFRPIQNQAVYFLTATQKRLFRLGICRESNELNGLSKHYSTSPLLPPIIILFIHYYDYYYYH